MTAPISLAALEDIERWPSRWRPAFGEEGEWQGFWQCVGADGDEDRVSAETDEDYANDLAVLVASLVNAAPALIAVVKAALTWQATPGATPEDDDAYERFCEALKAFTP